jgi:hypothetical protein
MEQKLAEEMGKGGFWAHVCHGLPEEEKAKRSELVLGSFRR